MYTLLYQTKMFTMTMDYNECRNRQTMQKLAFHNEDLSLQQSRLVSYPMIPALRELRICVLVNPTQLQQKSDIRVCPMPM